MKEEDVSKMAQRVAVDLLDENLRLRVALDRIAFCGAGEDYRVLREIARKALETQTT